MLVSAVVGRERLGLVRLLSTTLKLVSIEFAVVVGRAATAAAAVAGGWVETEAVLGGLVLWALF